MKRILTILVLLIVPFFAVFSQQTQEQKNNALRRSIKTETIESIPRLLREGADPNSPDEEGNTAAHLAASLYERQAMLILPMLTEAGCRFDVINNNGKTPLMLAGNYKNNHFKYILEWEQKHTPRFSGKYDNRKTYIANLFLTAFSSGDYPSTSIYEDSDGSDIPFLESLVKAGESIDGIDEHGRNLAWYVAGFGTTAQSKEPYGVFVLKWIIDRGLRFDITDKDGITPLYRTIGMDQIWADPRQDNFLLIFEWEQKHSPNFTGGKASRTEYLTIALEQSIKKFNNHYNERPETITSLLKAGADWRILTNEVNGEVILKLKDRLRLSYFIALLDHGMPVDIRDESGNTYLNLTSDSDIIKILILDYNADPTITNNRGNTPLHRYNIKVRHLLVEAGADINALNNEGFTPLMRNINSRSNSKYEIVKEFLDLGANPLAKTNDGRNALHLYLENFISDIIDDSPDPRVVKLLLDAGVNPADTSDDGDSALSLAIRISRKKIRKILPKQKKFL